MAPRTAGLTNSLTKRELSKTNNDLRSSPRLKLLNNFDGTRYKLKLFLA
jgi:hypothetical protein